MLCDERPLIFREATTRFALYFLVGGGSCCTSGGRWCTRPWSITMGSIWARWPFIMGSVWAQWPCIMGSIWAQWPCIMGSIWARWPCNMGSARGKFGSGAHLRCSVPLPIGLGVSSGGPLAGGEARPPRTRVEEEEPARGPGWDPWWWAGSVSPRCNSVGEKIDGGG